MILLIAILVPIVIIASWHDAEQTRRSVPAYFALLLTLEFTMIGVFAAADVFLFYVFFEVMLVPMYFLIGSYGTARRPSAVRRGEVLPVLAGRRPVHAGRGDRPVGGGAQPLRAPDLRLERADHAQDEHQHRALAVPRFLPGVRHQGAVLPVPHLAAGRRCGGTGRTGRVAGRHPGQGRYVRHPALLPAAVPERVALLRPAGPGAGAGRDHLRCAAGDRAERHEAPGRVHVGRALRVHRHRHLRLHHPGWYRRRALHAQPRSGHRPAVPGGRHAGVPAGVGAGR